MTYTPVDIAQKLDAIVRNVQAQTGYRVSRTSVLRLAVERLHESSKEALRDPFLR